MRAFAKPGEPPIRKQFGSFDGKDNRRSLWTMLEELGRSVTPEEGCARRLQFLAWCCDQSLAKGVRVGDIAGTVSETYWSIAVLASVHELDLDQAAQKLDRILSRLR